MFREALMLAGALCLCGCAAKPVTPVQMAQPGDESLGCPELRRQIAENRSEAQKYFRKDKNVENGNTAKTVGSAIPGLGILLAASIDLSNVEQIKARAMVDRDERLTFLARQKNCAE